MSELKLLPATVNISVKQKTDNVIEVTLTDAEGDPVDITNDDVVFKAWTNYGGTAKITKTNTTGQHSEPLLGKTRFTLLKTELVGVSPAREETWVHEVWRVIGGGSGQTNVYISGNLKLTPVLSS